MLRKNEIVVVDECRRFRLPWSPDLRPGDTFRVFRTRWHGKKGFLLTLVHKESLPAPKFKRVLHALKDRNRADIFYRLYIRHWLHTFRPDRGSFTGRIVFRHAVLARRELFSDDWPWMEYSDDYYRGRLRYPPALVRMLEDGLKGPFTEVTPAFWRKLERDCRAKARQEKKQRGEARKSGLYGVGLKKRWHSPKPLGLWFRLELRLT